MPCEKSYGWLAALILGAVATGSLVAACHTGCIRQSDCTSNLVCGPSSFCIVAPDLSDADGGSPSVDAAQANPDLAAEPDLSAAPDMSDAPDLSDEFPDLNFS